MPESEVDMAADKFEESKQLAETAMINLLENEVCSYSVLEKFLHRSVKWRRRLSENGSSLQL